MEQPTDSREHRVPLTVVVEPNPAGHRFQAAGFVLARASRDGNVLLLTSRGATSSEEYRVFLDTTGCEVREVFTSPTPPTGELVQVLRTLEHENDLGTVVVMEGDNHLKTWFLRGRLPRRPRVILFLTRYPARLGFRSSPAFWRVRIAKGVLVVAAMLTRTLHRSAGFAGRDDMAPGWVVKRARDPVQCEAHAADRPTLRAELGLPAERHLIGISGGINARKNPPLVLDAVLALGSDADLVLSGPFTDDLRAWLADLPAEHRARVLVEDGFLDSLRLDQYIAAVDVVVLAMTLEGPSGIQGKALAAGVPIVTAGSVTRERELRATHGGEAAEPTVASIAAALRRVLSSGVSPDLRAFPVPTGDTFAEAILGH